MTVAGGMFPPCLRYASDEHKVRIDRRPGYGSTVLEVCFDRARGMFQPCSKYFPTVHEGCFDRHSRFDLTVLEVSFNHA